jgi:CBS domain containing-hemolysin-like protein
VPAAADRSAVPALFAGCLLEGTPHQNLLGAIASPLHLGLAAVAGAVAAFGALATAGLLGYSPTRLTQLLEDRGHPDPAGRTAHIDTHDDEYAVIAALVTAAGWILGVSAMTAAVAEPHHGWALTGYMVAMLWLAVSVPMGIARLRPERTVMFVAPWLRPLWLVLRLPLVLPILAATRLALTAIRMKRTDALDTAEVQKQVIAAVADTVAEDTLAQEERTWIGNIIGLKDLLVSTLMTPRPDIIALPESLSLREAVHKALEHGFSRFPVYRDRIDEVVGIFYVKDALRAMQENRDALASPPLRSLLRPVIFMPETTGAAQLLRRFQAGNEHMAMVIDEYGTLVGLVTVEDVLEQIVGDIADEYDSPASAPGDAEQIRVVESGRVLEIPARTPVAEVNRLLGSELPEQGDWETVAGLVIARLNHIPLVDETVAIDGVEFRVLQADDRRIRRLRASTLAPQPAEGA